MPRAGSTRPFWRGGNEGVLRPKDAPPEHRRKRDVRPQANEDISTQIVITADLKRRLVAEKAARNLTISALVREVISEALDVEERARRRGEAEKPDQHQVVVPEVGERSVVIHVYTSPFLKRRLIEASETHESMSAYVRQCLRDYFWRKRDSG